MCIKESTKLCIIILYSKYLLIDYYYPLSLNLILILLLKDIILFIK